MEPKSFVDALRRPDADKWVAAALAEIEAHLENGTWELTQLPPGRHAIGSRCVFKIKRQPDGSIDKYKGLSSRRASLRSVVSTITRCSRLRREWLPCARSSRSRRLRTWSWNQWIFRIDAEIYMRLPEGLHVDGDPEPGEDPAAGCPPAEGAMVSSRGHGYGR
jgi:hypothetical protein